MARNYLIVGGTAGIGLALAQQLRDEGESVHVLARHAPEDPLEDVQYHQADVLEGPFDTEGLPDELHGLAYCPGSITLKPFKNLSEEDYLKDWRINVLGAVNSVKAVWKPLQNAEGAGIVFFSTVAASTGLSYHASIASAKAGLEGLARTLAAELSKQRVRVNVVAPSITDTRLAGNLLKTEQQREASKGRHPLAQIGEPADMAQAARFLLTPGAGWVTGQTLHVDGGLSSLRPL